MQLQLTQAAGHAAGADAALWAGPHRVMVAPQLQGAQLLQGGQGGEAQRAAERQGACRGKVRGAVGGTSTFTARGLRCMVLLTSSCTFCVSGYACNSECVAL
jgi:hypothetical protein